MLEVRQFYVNFIGIEKGHFCVDILEERKFFRLFIFFYSFKCYIGSNILDIFPRNITRVVALLGQAISQTNSSVSKTIDSLFPMLYTIVEVERWLFSHYHYLSRNLNLTNIIRDVPSLFKYSSDTMRFRRSIKKKKEFSII